VTTGKGDENGLLSQAELLQFTDDDPVAARSESLVEGFDGQTLLSGFEIGASEIEVMDDLLGFLFQRLDTEGGSCLELSPFPCQAVAEVRGRFQQIDCIRPVRADR
jgi:hypothetical protein